MKQAAMAAAAEFTWSNAALQYEQIFTELGVKDVLNGAVAAWGWVMAKISIDRIVAIGIMRLEKKV